LSYLTHLECSECEKQHDADKVQTVCDGCGKPLFTKYDLDVVSGALTKVMLVGREASMWRCFQLLTVRERRNIVSLGEGWTPLTAATKLGEEIGVSGLCIKDEAIIPTGTFKARCPSAAISKAKELGVRRIALPSGGNAANGLSYSTLALASSIPTCLRSTHPQSPPAKGSTIGASELWKTCRAC